MNGGDMGLLIAGFAVCLAATLGLMFLMLHWFHQRIAADQPPLTAEQTTRIAPSAPQLQAHPHAELRAERAREDALLHGYAWHDADHRQARIPIARAMELSIGHSLDDVP